MGYRYQKEALIAIPLMKCIPPPGFRIYLADIFLTDNRISNRSDASLWGSELHYKHFIWKHENI